MSLVFNNTSGTGIIQLIEHECGFNPGDISGSTMLLRKFTGLVNVSMDEFWNLAIEAGGTWPPDDINQTDYPIILRNLVSGQRDYTFDTDGSGNKILDIYRVFVKDVNGVYNEIFPVDQQSEDITLITDGQDRTGTPTKYDKTANGIILDYVPNYNSTNGIKVLINREATRFTVSDTTKYPGVPGILHEWFVISPSYRYAAGPAQLPNKKDLEIRKIQFEAKIRDYFSNRAKDERPRLRVKQESTR